MPTAAPTKKKSAATAAASADADLTPVYRARLKRLAALLQNQEVPLLLITNPRDVAYLTGFLGGDSFMLAFAGGTGGAGTRPIVISDFRYSEELEPVRRFAEVIIREGPMPEWTAKTITRTAGGGAVGFQSEHMPVAERDNLGGRLGSAFSLIPTKGLLSLLRLRKDQHEAALISAAAKITEQALLALLPTIKPGQTELEIAARLEFEMKVRGASAPAFETIIAADATGSLPHYRPARRKVRKNTSLLIDWGAVRRGYFSDMTRTFALGKWPAKVREIYEITLEAQEASAAALAPGRTTREIDAIARDIITKAGYGEQFGHGLGHGFGMAGKEEPYLTHLLPPQVLEEGMVCTVEPGIYLPGIGGVRIEDDYIITKTGARNLCTLPKTLEWSTL